MGSEKEGSKSDGREVAPIGAALTPGLIPFWSPKLKGFATSRQSVCGSCPAPPPAPKS
ncbi:hypothetical protein FHT76_007325 [Rhizobium sp. BK176]|nr:hypothetical protein [Rhizobium sp. BK176]